MVEEYTIRARVHFAFVWVLLILTCVAFWSTRWISAYGTGAEYYIGLRQECTVSAGTEGCLDIKYTDTHHAAQGLSIIGFLGWTIVALLHIPLAWDIGLSRSLDRGVFAIVRVAFEALSAVTWSLTWGFMWMLDEDVQNVGGSNLRLHHAYATWIALTVWIGMAAVFLLDVIYTYCVGEYSSMRKG